MRYNSFLALEVWLGGIRCLSMCYCQAKYFLPYIHILSNLLVSVGLSVLFWQLCVWLKAWIANYLQTIGWALFDMSESQEKWGKKLQSAIWFLRNLKWGELSLKITNKLKDTYFTQENFLTYIFPCKEGHRERMFSSIKILLSVKDRHVLKSGEPWPSNQPPKSPSSVYNMT